MQLIEYRVDKNQIIKSNLFDSYLQLYDILSSIWEYSWFQLRALKTHITTSTPYSVYCISLPLPTHLWNSLKKERKKTFIVCRIFFYNPARLKAFTAAPGQSRRVMFPSWEDKIVSGFLCLWNADRPEIQQLPRAWASVAWWEVEGWELQRRLSGGWLYSLTKGVEA